MYGEKFAFKNRLGYSLLLGRKFTVFLCVTLYLRAISKYKRFNGRFFALRVWGLIHGGAYFR